MKARSGRTGIRGQSWTGYSAWWGEEGWAPPGVLHSAYHSPHCCPTGHPPGETTAAAGASPTLKNFYDITYCVLSMDRWTNQPVAVDS